MKPNEIETALKFDVINEAEKAGIHDGMEQLALHKVHGEGLRQLAEEVDDCPFAGSAGSPPPR